MPVQLCRDEARARHIDTISMNAVFQAFLSVAIHRKTI